MIDLVSKLFKSLSYTQGSLKPHIWYIFFSISPRLPTNSSKKKYQILIKQVPFHTLLPRMQPIIRPTQSFWQLPFNSTYQLAISHVYI